MERPSHGGTRLLRSWNKAKILNYLREHPGLSRAALARTLRLSPSAVTEIVRDLLDQGLLTEKALPPKGKGRPSLALEVEGERNLVLVWEIDVDRMAVALMNLQGEVRIRRLLPPAPNDPDKALTLLQETTRPLLEEVRVLAAGLSVPGLLDPPEGHLTLAPNLGWKDLPLGELFRKALGELGLETPWMVENEANAAAYGFYAHARGRLAAEDCVYLNLGVGVGGGVVAGGQIYHGARFHAGEVGHITLDPEGPSCGCGKRGCAEAFLSYRRWQEGASEERLLEMAERLAQLAAIILSTLDPSLVVLGGPLAEAAGSFLLAEARARLPRYALPVHVPEQLVLSPLGREAVILGMGALAADRFLEELAFTEVV